MTFCKTNGINIHYTRTGENKHTLVLLHGLAANGLCWTGLVHFLEKECDIIMPDARGHGKSSVPKTGYKYDDHANDIIGLINTLGLPPAFLIGHSMGGMTASLIARSNPELLRGLILADPPFLTTSVQRQIHQSDVKDQHRLFLRKSLQDMMSDFKSKHPNRSPDTIKFTAQARLQTSLEAFDVLTPPNPDYKQLISAIKTPSLLVYGDKGVVTTDVAEEVKRLNSRFQIVKIPDVGHGLHYDQPDGFAAIVLSFIHSIENHN
jgi:pimeloyl-ACP methyl ester carboxylesterase